MNNQSPLVPQGSVLEQKNQGRARVKIAVFVVLAIHGIGLLALLMQGCKKEPDVSLQQSDATNNAATTFVEPTNTGPETPTAIAYATTNGLVQPDATMPTPTPPVPTPPSTTPSSDYKVAKGDNLSTIATKFHVTVKALTDYNPGVEPTKLQIGQTLHIPPATAAVGVAAGDAATKSIATNGQQIYAVKSGDNLIKIASHFGTTVKAIRSANNLTTDKIVVGQKLKVPVKASAAAAGPVTPVEASTTTAATSAPVTAPTLK